MASASFPVGEIYSGKKAVLEGLRKRANLGFDVYADWIESELDMSNASESLRRG
ncbi:hypothetical protein D3C83_161510 [compost metagenome]